MEFKKVVAGLVKYIDRNICPNMNDLQEIGYRALCSRVMSNLEQYKTAISNNAFLQTFAIIDADGNVDLEGLMSSLKGPIEEKEKIKIKIPFYGTFTFTASDIDDIYNTITKG